MFSFRLVCVCRVIMKITVIVIANKCAHSHVKAVLTIQSIQYSIKKIHDIYIKYVAISCPAISCLAIWSVIFSYSCIFSAPSA